MDPIKLTPDVGDTANEGAAAIVVVGDSVLKLKKAGILYDIISPWSNQESPLTFGRVMDGGWIYLGSKSAEERIIIDFISLSDFSLVARWFLDDGGFYLSQTRLHSSDIILSEQSYTHRNSSSVFSSIATGFANDLQIYSAIRYLLNDYEGAVAYLDGYAPPPRIERPVTSGSVNLVLIFNHNYARNIPVIDNMYRDRVSDILYVLPNIAPRSERCCSFPAGSFSYHVLIYYAIERILREKPLNREGWYLFSQDDVYLNKHFSEKTVDRFADFDESTSALYYFDATQANWDYNSDWAWNKRILNRIERQADNTVGNGFEGFRPLFHRDSMVAGVGDIFAIRGKYLAYFAEILGSFISQDIFPEVSIPTALKFLARRTATRLGLFSGLYLWGADNRKNVDERFINEFNQSRKLFVHPCKASILRRISNL